MEKILCDRRASPSFPKCMGQWVHNGNGKRHLLFWWKNRSNNYIFQMAWKIDKPDTRYFVSFEHFVVVAAVLLSIIHHMQWHRVFYVNNFSVLKAFAALLLSLCLAVSLTFLWRSVFFLFSTSIHFPFHPSWFWMCALVVKCSWMPKAFISTQLINILRAGVYADEAFECF